MGRVMRANGSRDAHGRPQGKSRGGKAGVQLVPAVIGHVAPIAAHMREADRREVWAASRVRPDEALAYGLQRSCFAYTWLMDDAPVAMFGVGDVNILTGEGAPWLLGTDEVARHGRVFLRLSLKWRDRMRARYALLRNFVDGRNVVSIRWLQWLGFELKQPVMMNGVKFYVFEMQGQEAVSAIGTNGEGRSRGVEARSGDGEGRSTGGEGASPDRDVKGTAWSAQARTGKVKQEAVRAQARTGKVKQEAVRHEVPTGKVKQCVI